MFTTNTWLAFVAGGLVAILASQFFASHPLSERTATASLAGTFINGNYIPPGTSPAQIPSRHEEDYYGSSAGKGD
jgi:hypothetical protein